MNMSYDICFVKVEAVFACCGKYGCWWFCWRTITDSIWRWQLQCLPKQTVFNIHHSSSSNAEVVHWTPQKSKENNCAYSAIFTIIWKCLYLSSNIMEQWAKKYSSFGELTMIIFRSIWNVCTFPIYLWAGTLQPLNFSHLLLIFIHYFIFVELIGKVLVTPNSTFCYIGFLSSSPVWLFYHGFPQLE